LDFVLAIFDISSSIASVGPLILTFGCPAPVPTLNAGDLVKRADLVVMGRIANVSDAGPATIETPNGPLQARQMRGEIEVDRVLKGTLETSSVSFQFAMPDMPMAGHYRRMCRAITNRQSVDRPSSIDLLRRPFPPRK